MSDPGSNEDNPVDQTDRKPERYVWTLYDRVVVSWFSFISGVFGILFLSSVTFPNSNPIFHSGVLVFGEILGASVWALGLNIWIRRVFLNSNPSALPTVIRVWAYRRNTWVERVSLKSNDASSASINFVLVSGVCALGMSLLVVRRYGNDSVLFTGIPVGVFMILCGLFALRIKQFLNEFSQKGLRVQFRTMDLLLMVSVWGNLGGWMFISTRSSIKQIFESDLIQFTWLLIIQLSLGMWIVGGFLWGLKYETTIREICGWKSRWPMLIMGWSLLPFTLVLIVSFIIVPFSILWLAVKTIDRDIACEMLVISVPVIIWGIRYSKFLRRVNIAYRSNSRFNIESKN